MRKSFLCIAGFTGILAVLAVGGLASLSAVDTRKYIADKVVDEVLDDYLNRVVVPGLDSLTDSLMDLNKITQELTTQPTEQTPLEIAKAWRVARGEWNKTAPFWFGPAIYYGLDLQISAWPIDEPLINRSLQQIAAGEMEVDAQYLRDPLSMSQRGFHTADYLLFRNGQARHLDDITAAERRYLSATVQAMTEDALSLEARWIGFEHLADDKKSVLKASAVKIDDMNFGKEFLLAGSSESRYEQKSDALLEIFQEAVGAAEGMCPAIIDSFNNDNYKYGLAWYNQDEIGEYQNGISGLENAYYGGEEGNRESSISELVAAHNPILDKKIAIGFADFKYRIESLKNVKQLSKEQRDLLTRRAEDSCLKLEARIEVGMNTVFALPNVLP